MKVIAFNGSPRKDGNTARLIGHVFRMLEAEGIECEMVQLAGKKIGGCTACAKCKEMKDGLCYGRKDFGAECIARLPEFDGIIMASPTYFADVTPELKALSDRIGYVAGNKPDILARKVGAAVVAQRRGGAVNTFDTINHMFMIRQVVIASSTYWNFGVGGPVGAVDEDAEGIRTLENLGRNMAWLLKHTAHVREDGGIPGMSY